MPAKNNKKIRQGSEEISRIIYPEVEDVIGDHEVAIQRYGGASGFLLGGYREKIEAAIGRMKQEFAECDLFWRAAALIQSLNQHHPFVDGNKRTSLIIADIFLQQNGVDLRGNTEIAERIIRFIEDKDLDSFAQWLRENSEILLLTPQ